MPFIREIKELLNEPGDFFKIHNLTTKRISIYLKWLDAEKNPIHNTLLKTAKN